MVALQYQRIATAQGLFDICRAASGIGQYAQPPRPIIEHKLHRLGGIMRNRVGNDFDLADRERPMGINFMEMGNAGKGFWLAAQCAVGEPNRQVEFARQTRHAATVVAVLMRDDNTAQLFGRYVQTRQTQEGVFQSKTAIHQHACRAGCDQQRVAFAAAAQRGKLHEAYRITAY